MLGPPGSGKTSGVLIPSILLARGPVVSSSVKADVITATAAARSQHGRVWHFDPTGKDETPGVTPARWSPLVGLSSWDDAVSRAQSMTQGMSSGSVTNEDHWITRAQDGLAVLLWAAALTGEPIGTVATWAVSLTNPDTRDAVGRALDNAGPEDREARDLARALLLDVSDPNGNERASIRSTITRALSVYRAMSARKVGAAPNFDPHEFVRSRDTLYVTADPRDQTQLAPLIVGLLEEIRLARYALTKRVELGREPEPGHLTMVLDEVATTAPIPLPQIISEAGGQGMHLVVGLQSMVLARQRWGDVARAFLTLFPVKVIHGGDFDHETVQALSTAAGMREVVRTNWALVERQRVGLLGTPVAVNVWQPSKNVSTEPVLTPGDVTRIPTGRVLVWNGTAWGLLRIGMHWQRPEIESVIRAANARGITRLPAPPELVAGAGGSVRVLADHGTNAAERRLIRALTQGRATPPTEGTDHE